VFSSPGPAAPAVGAAPSAPGEYTRVFGAQASYAATAVGSQQGMAAPAQPQYAPPAAAAPAPAAKQQIPLLPVVIVTAVVLLAALALLLYFLGKK